MRVNFFAVLSALLLSSVSSAVMAPNGFEGVYKGGMTLFGKTEEIPLQISLVLTAEFVQVASANGVVETQQVIDAAFIVDDEGGPYGFYKVSYNLDKSQIDLRYNRPTITTTTVSIPSSLRLIGTMGGEGVLSGRVISGNNGPIGTFKVTRGREESMMPVPKYFGKWAGKLTMTPGNAVVPFAVEVAPSNLANVNPTDWELDFTPGKLGHYTWKDVDLNIDRVLVDYLRRRMFLIETAGTSASGLGSSVSLECDLSTLTRDQNTLNGTLYSMYRGKRGTFALKRIK